jgi:hypothetical protein
MIETVINQKCGHLDHDTMSMFIVNKSRTEVDRKAFAKAFLSTIIGDECPTDKVVISNIIVMAFVDGSLLAERSSETRTTLPLEDIIVIIHPMCRKTVEQVKSYIPSFAATPIEESVKVQYVVQYEQIDGNDYRFTIESVTKHINSIIMTCPDVPL